MPHHVVSGLEVHEEALLLGREVALEVPPCLCQALKVHANYESKQREAASMAGRNQGCGTLHLLVKEVLLGR